ncbi:hypothetical protein SERLA73DRAFT_174970 [Serpula lacrymans var. lacrymans S7.3]|uniref:Uncharacterized protein n=1 Tax=Serpula lacrymans var. lacrymans (strain S7.3) TaxID=936435 RepID=F8PJR0_SERL3|nr:hypothetical protein SERLA73DRAFT_174970 [Serpula lacrymans var. lacrymans S7.3]
MVAFAGEYCENEEAIAPKLESVFSDHHDYNSEYATDEDADRLSHSEHLHASVSSHDLDSAMLQRLDRRLESSRTSLGEGEPYISPRDMSPLLCVTETHSPIPSRSESPVHFQHFPRDNPNTFRFEARSPRTIFPSLESLGTLPLSDGALGVNLAPHSHSATSNDAESQHTSFLQESDDGEDGGLGLQGLAFNYEARPSSVASSDRLSDDFEGLSSPETSIILISKESLPKHIQSGQAYLVATSARSTSSQSPISSDSGSPLLSSTLSPSDSPMPFHNRQGQHLEMFSSSVSRRTGHGNHVDVKQGSELPGKADENEPSKTSRHAFDGHALRFHCRLCQVNPCEGMTVTMCGHIFCNKLVWQTFPCFLPDQGYVDALRERLLLPLPALYARQLHCYIACSVLIFGRNIRESFSAVVGCKGREINFFS